MFTREDIDNIKEKITPANIMTFLEELNANPKYSDKNVIISRTICHEGSSQKLYYYCNTKTFHCYTNCGTFDIFGLIQKVFNIDFYQSIYYVLNKFNINYNQTKDFFYNELRQIEKKYFQKHKNIKDKNIEIQNIELKEYDNLILDKFMYPRIIPWEKEGISKEVINNAKIGYYPGSSQITIPHFDKDNRLIGIRGRQLGKEEASLFGKYRPLYINGQMYNHPLGFNLYNLNHSKNNIKKMGIAFVFESEKSCLLYRSYFGEENDISVAVCGSSLSDYQVQLLLESGAKEICVAFDRQFQKIGDSEFKKLTKTLTNLNIKYKNIVKISFIFDKKMITQYKDAPIDRGPNIFLQLYQERLIL